MKKIVSLLMVLCMACMLIPAMAEESVSGDWYLKTVVMDGQEIDPATMGVQMKLTLNEDGTVGMIMPGSDEPHAGTWTLEGDQITITVDDEPASGTATADSITLADEYQTMVFTREAPEAIVLPEVKAADSAEVFYGDWSCSAMAMMGMYIDAEAYEAQAEGDTLPGLTVTEDSIQFTGDGLYAMLFSFFDFTPVFENGAITAYVPEDSASSGTEGKIELLEDDNIRFSVNMDGDTIMLYFVPALAAAEEPAA